jgi:hypothetical protein
MTQHIESRKCRDESEGPGCLRQRFSHARVPVGDCEVCGAVEDVGEFEGGVDYYVGDVSVSGLFLVAFLLV